jgi:glycosyltransferase involved in cell wall biosynthesis
MRKPEVSVIIPARNRAPLLERALHSVAAQEDVVCDVIVIDDASEPPLEKLLEKSLRNRVRILRNPLRRNAAFSRNRGAGAATAAMLAFLDSDDVWRPHHLRVALAALKREPKLCLYVTPLHDRGGEATLIGDPYEQRFGRGVDFRTSGLVCSRRLFEATGGFDAHLEKHQDWDFALRAGRQFELLLGVEATVKIDRDAEGRMSRTPNLAASEAFLKKHLEHMSPRHLRYFFGGMIRHAVQSRDKKVVADAKVLIRSYFVPRKLPAKARLAWHLPWVAYRLTAAKRAMQSQAPS